MRRITLLLCLAFLFHASLPAQFHPDLHQLHYSNTAGEKGVTTYIHKLRPLPYKAIWELEDGSRWSENLHTFDARGNLLTRKRWFSDSITSVQEFTYDSRDRLVSESFQRSDGVKGHVDYEYAGDKKVLARCEGLNGWFYGEIHYHYSTTGLPDSASLHMKEKAVGFIAYSYDERDRVAVETWTFDSGFSQNFRYEYVDKNCTAYRSSNVFIPPACREVVRREEYTYNGEGGGPSYYSYDDQNRLLEKTFVRDDGLKTVTTFVYHENGLLKESMRHYNDGKTGTFSYVYDEYGQLIQRDFIRSDGLKGKESYLYDEYGKLLSGVYDKFDGWLTGKLEFTHDRYDRIVHARYTGEDGQSAKIRFLYKDDGLLYEIAWVFQEGHTQTYRFFY